MNNEHEQDVRQDRADDRGRRHLVELALQREQHHEELGQVAQRALDHPGRPGPQPVTQGLDAAPHQAGEQRQRDTGDDKRGDAPARLGVVRDGRRDHHDHRQANGPQFRSGKKPRGR